MKLHRAKICAAESKTIQSKPFSSLKTEENDRWMTTAEAARYLKIEIGSFYNLLSQGKIPYYKLQTQNRFLRSELDSLILSHPRGVRNVD